MWIQSWKWTSSVPWPQVRLMVSWTVLGKGLWGDPSPVLVLVRLTLYSAELTFRVSFIIASEIGNWLQEGKTARRPQTKPDKNKQTKQKATGTGEGELSIPCEKDLMLFVLQRLVLEGKIQQAGKYSLQEVLGSPFLCSAFNLQH